MKDEKYYLDTLRQFKNDNFILKLRAKTYEHILRFQFISFCWLQSFFSLLFKDCLTKNLHDLYTAPNNLLQINLDLINKFENHLILNFKDYVPIKLDGYNESIEDFSLNITKAQNQIKNIKNNDFLNVKNLPKGFVIELKRLLANYNINIDVDNFLNSLEMSKVIFELYSNINIFFPYTITNFDSKNIFFSTESLIEWIKSQHKDYFINIIDNLNFFINPKIYLSEILNQHLIDSLYNVKFKEVYEKFLNTKKSNISFYSSKIDLKTFELFSKYILKLDTINNENKNINLVNNLQSNMSKLDKNDIFLLLTFFNISLSISDYTTYSDFEQLNPIVENFLLKKFLVCALEQLGYSININNPIRYLLNHER